MIEYLSEFADRSQHIESVLDKIQDRNDALTRYIVLVGDPVESLYEHMVRVILGLPEYPRPPVLVRAPTVQVYLNNHPEVRLWIENHMVSSTPAILLVRKGEQDGFIAGAVPPERFKERVDQFCSERPGDCLQEMMESVAAEREQIRATQGFATEYAGEFKKVGVTPEGVALYVMIDDPGVDLQLELPPSRAEAGTMRCATCDGGGCPDCTDPA